MYPLNLTTHHSTNVQHYSTNVPLTILPMYPLTFYQCTTHYSTNVPLTIPPMYPLTFYQWMYHSPFLSSAGTLVALARNTGQCAGAVGVAVTKIDHSETFLCLFLIGN